MKTKPTVVMKPNFERTDLDRPSSKHQAKKNKTSNGTLPRPYPTFEEEDQVPRNLTTQDPPAYGKRPVKKEEES